MQGCGEYTENGVIKDKLSAKWDPVNINNSAMKGVKEGCEGLFR